MQVHLEKCLPIVFAIWDVVFFKAIIALFETSGLRKKCLGSIGRGRFGYLSHIYVLMQHWRATALSTLCV